MVSPILLRTPRSTLMRQRNLDVSPHSGELHALHSMNRLRIPFIRDGLRPPEVAQDTTKPKEYTYAPLAGLRIVDVGCGGGILSELFCLVGQTSPQRTVLRVSSISEQPLAAIGANVLGIDQVEETIRTAQSHAEMTARKWPSPTFRPPEYRLVSLEQLSEEMPGQFDAVVMSEVVEHVTHWEDLIKHAVTILKPGGMLFLTTINQTAASFLFGIVGAEYIARVVPRGTHEWQKFVSPVRLQSAMIKNGLHPNKFVGMCYNPLTDRWSWNKSMAVNYAASAVKI
ncbi:3-demethylubiquinone-9 3-O-methyltransferase [Opisthorchis viverrini]|uniref:Ubiquinone biosynthesis O-methyltransferase, mitochondrial n=1 Tax=Opisthorchis viverrini TaxID=6198 RepID=A0A1S8WY30_OPIVI|nr:3-demethylubiquinone-9 3-O-methyltransferase [Opisthorchis viverrini]